MEIQIHLEGQDVLNKYFQTLLTRNKAVLKSAIEKSCVLLVGNTKEEAPVDKGFLRGSLAFRVTDTISGISGIVGTNKIYAPPLEFLNYKRRRGIRKGQSTKFMQPAFERSFNDIVEILTDKMKEILKS